MVGDLGEGGRSQVPQLGKIVQLIEPLTLVTDGKLGHIMFDPVIRHQRAHGSAQVVRRELDPTGLLQPGDKLLTTLGFDGRSSPRETRAYLCSAADWR